MHRKLTWVLPLLVAIALLASACGQAATPTAAPEEPTAAPVVTAAPEEPTAAPAGPEALRVALILPGRIDDLAWNQAGYRSFLRLQGALGAEIETSWVENVYTNVDIVPALRDYAQRGYDIIIGHGFQFQEPLYEVAPEFPDTMFACGGWEALPNMSIYDVRTDQTGYLEGFLAARMSQSGIIGYVAGLEVAELARFAKGYQLGATAADPNIDIRFVYTGDFHDVAAARETVVTLAGQGVDVLAFMGDGTSLGALAGCREAGIYCMGNGTDVTQQAPELILTSGVWQWDAVWQQILQDYRAGTRGMQQYWADMADGGLALTPLSSVVPEEVATELATLQEQIIAGTLETGGP
jgi:basic membrane protein A